MKMSKDLFEALVDHYTSKLKGFYKTMDRAHGLDHFKRVFDCAVILNNSLPEKSQYDEELLLVVAYTHDIYSGVDRENHHVFAGQFVRNNARLIFDRFNPAEIEMIASACEQHRASFEGEFSNLFCELMNCADRELPTSAKVILDRAIMYREDHYPNETKEQILVESINHLKEKFGHGGYSRYPDLYERIFKEELDLIRDEISHM